MPCVSYYLIIYTTVLVSYFQFSDAGNNDTDRLTLLEIKAKIIDPLGALNSWNDSHFCNWYGVKCGRLHQRVTALDLQSLKLSGSISPYIGNLSFLRDLQLQNNSISGNLPPEIGRLHRLENLLILNNSMTGEIPSNISGCYALIQLRAGNNKLVGSVPDVLGSLQNLQVLSLSLNNLTGNIPSSLGNLSSISFLAIAGTNLVGSIPTSLGSLKTLTVLTFSQNKLSGLVPSSIFNLSRLTTLDIGFNNGLEGSLPSDIGFTLPLLSWLSLSENSFSGIIPTSISNLSNLGLLQLAENNFRGKVPFLKNLINLRVLALGINSFRSGQSDDLEFVYSLGNATMLSYLDIYQSNFSGNFPGVICNFMSLSFLILGENKIGGKIPVCIGNLAELQYFDIRSNQISGVIPRNIGKIQNLEQLYLGDNQLSGYIPYSVGNLTKLSTLNLAGNNLIGQIPSSIGNCTNLLEMILSRNNLNGSIPGEIFSLSTLQKLYLNDNQLTGPLNLEVAQLRYIVELGISSNMLTGEIPSSLSACLELELLYMDDNFFEGVIPDALKTLINLRKFSLSQNKLSGKIPKFLVSIPLKYLNLSYNNFTGEVPIGGVFGNVTGISIVGNEMLCGGIPELNLPKCFHENTRLKRSGHRKSLILAMIFGFLGVIMLMTFASVGIFWYIKRSRKITNARNDTSSSLSNLSYQSLLKATNGFSSENVIGSGAFGIVYKGTLDPDETLFAIKVFKLEHQGASKSFMAECGVLRNIRHRNLVKVITVCSSIDYQGNDFKALVYEYIVNGSLEDWLHPSHDYKSLTFFQRLNVAVDVAFAMEYLHHDYGASIVHCDLKPSNILLDEDMVAHVGDFGLAKFLSTSQAFRTSSLGYRGTVGYAPPEYGLGNEVTTSGDVYSFGILLMELVTGKRPTLDMFRDGLSLNNFVQAALPDHVIEIIDGALLGNELNEDIENNRTMRMMSEASVSILGLALSCSAEFPPERLDMKEVVSELLAIRNRFTRTSSK